MPARLHARAIVAVMDTTSRVKGLAGCAGVQKRFPVPIAVRGPAGSLDLVECPHDAGSSAACGTLRRMSQEKTPGTGSPWLGPTSTSERIPLQPEPGQIGPAGVDTYRTSARPIFYQLGGPTPAIVCSPTAELGAQVRPVTEQQPTVVYQCWI